jgi:hypothetical protein
VPVGRLLDLCEAAKEGQRSATTGRSSYVIHRREADSHEWNPISGQVIRITAQEQRIQRGGCGGFGGTG